MDPETAFDAWFAAGDSVKAVKLLGDLGRRPSALERIRVAELGRAASTRFPADTEVLLAVAKMYLRAGLPRDAQEVLTRILRRDSDEPRTYPIFAEALLRQGDARRALVALDEAIAKGIDDEATRLRREEAEALSIVQENEGTEAAARQAEEFFSGDEANLDLSPPVKAAASKSKDARRDETDASAAKARAAVDEARRADPRAEPSSESEPAVQSSRSGGRAPMSSRVPRPGPGQSEPPRPAGGRPGLHKSTSSPPAHATADSQPPAPPDKEAGEHGGHYRSVDSRYASRAPRRASLPPGDDDGIADDVRASLRAPRPVGSIDDLVGALEAASDVEAEDRTRASASKRPPADGEKASKVGSPRPVATTLEVADEDSGEDSGAIRRAAPLPPILSEPPPALTQPPPKPTEPDRPILGRRALIAGGIAALGLGGLGIAYLVRGRRGGPDEPEPELEAITDTMMRGGLRNLAEARGQVDGLLENPDASKYAALWQLVGRVLAVLEEGRAADALRRAMGDARAGGVDESWLSFAELAHSLSDAQPAPLGKALEEHAEELEAAAGIHGAMLLLVATELRMRTGDNRGAVAFAERALALEPRLFAARWRLVRELLLGVDPVRGMRELDDAAFEDRTETSVLRSIPRVGDHGEESEALLQTALSGIADLPQGLSRIATSLDAVRGNEPARDQTVLSEAIAAEPAPSVLTFIGLAALSAAEVKNAQTAVDRAMKLTPGFVPARVLDARIAVTRGDLATYDAVAKDLDAALTADLDAFLAYEDWDLARMDETLKKVGQGSSAAAVLAQARQILAGQRAQSDDAIRALATNRLFFGDLFAVDAALDRGDVGLAGELVSRWLKGIGAPHKTRLARLDRLKDRAPQAKALSQGAARNARGFWERLQSAGSRKARSALAERVEAESETTRRWITAYQRARDGGTAAAAALVKMDPPDDTAALPLRLVAGMALSEGQDRKRSLALIKPILEIFPDNVDARTAAKGVGYTPVP